MPSSDQPSHRSLAIWRPWLAWAALLCMQAGLGAEEESVYGGWRGYWVECIATAYSPHDAIDAAHWSSRDTVTSIGVDWQKAPYGIAVPYRKRRPLFVPYRTQLIVPPGYGYLDHLEGSQRIFMADDTGGIISTRSQQTGVPHIDLRFATEKEALRFGARKRIPIFVITSMAAGEPDQAAPLPSTEAMPALANTSAAAAPADESDGLPTLRLKPAPRPQPTPETLALIQRPQQADPPALPWWQAALRDPGYFGGGRLLLASIAWVVLVGVAGFLTMRLLRERAARRHWRAQAGSAP